MIVVMGVSSRGEYFVDIGDDNTTAVRTRYEAAWGEEVRVYFGYDIRNDHLVKMSLAQYMTADGWVRCDLDVIHRHIMRTYYTCAEGKGAVDE